MANFINPYSDDDMVYNLNDHRYVLTEEYLRNKGVDLSIILNTDSAPDPANVPALFLDRMSALVYGNIYSYGRSKEDKEYILACNPAFRSVIKRAMLERIMYVASSGDMSLQTGALIEQGTRINVKDLVAAPEEENILRTAGLLHRGQYYINKDNSLTW